MVDKKIRVVILCGKGASSRMMFHGISSHVNVVKVIIENKSSALSVIRKRIKRLGMVKAFGQVSFLLFNKLCCASLSYSILSMNFSKAAILTLALIKILVVDSKILQWLMCSLFCL